MPQAPIASAHVAVHSGTVVVERMWAILKSMLPLAARYVSFRCFTLLAQVVRVRYSCSLFHLELPCVTDGDPLMAQLGIRASTK